MSLIYKYRLPLVRYSIFISVLNAQTMRKNVLLLVIVIGGLSRVVAQDTLSQMTASDSKLAGYHIGVVQILFAANHGEVTWLNQSDFYSIGFPMGITFHSKGSSKFDLEFVPVFKPYASQEDKPYEVHFIVHPGILFPMHHGWTFGLRAAFEVGDGVFGVTPLLNKSFGNGDRSHFFIEIVAPGRFGPNKDSSYTQLAGVHLGFGF